LAAKAARIFAGVTCGGLLGLGAGALALKVFPWDPSAFGGEYHGMFTVFLFCLPVLAAYTVLGVILGIVAAFGPGGRCLIGFTAGAAIGFAGGLGAIIVSPRFLARSSASDGIEVFPDGIIMVVLSLMIVVTGAVIGGIFGRTRRST